MISPATLIVLLLPLLLIGTLVWLFWRRPVAQDPLCGQCGYIVRGISSLTCPECGSDLREVGIHPPGRLTPIDIRHWIVTWTAVLLMLAVPLSMFLQHVAGPALSEHRLTRNISYHIAPVQGVVQAEMTGRKICWGIDRYRATVSMQTLTLSPGNGMGGRSLTVDLSSRSYEFNDANGALVRKPDGFGTQTIVDWLAAQGTDPSLRATSEVADNILIAIEQMPHTQNGIQLAAQRNDSWGVTVHPGVLSIQPLTLWWSWAAWVTVWLMVWLMGIRRIRRRHRQPSDRPLGMAGQVP